MRSALVLAAFALAGCTETSATTASDTPGTVDASVQPAPDGGADAAIVDATRGADAASGADAAVADASSGADATSGADAAGRVDAAAAGDAAPDSGPTYTFTVSPIDLSSIAYIVGMGTFGVPGHVIPNEHGGIFLTGRGVTLRSPGALRIANLRRTTYMTSPTRQGEADYAIMYFAGTSEDGVFGHVTSLAPRFAALMTGLQCSTYSTDVETVESCSVNVSVDAAPGEALGTVGGATANVVDWGHHDSAITNAFANPSRYTPALLHTVCPYDRFEPTVRAALTAKLQRTAVPRCGEVAVDVPGTAQGVWVDATHATAQLGDETSFITLAPQYDDPVHTLRLAAAPTGIGGQQLDVAIAATGSKNRPFDTVTANGAITCYAQDSGTASLFVAVLPNGQLRVERVAHAAGQSPCDANPTTWSFGATAMNFIR
jgi:hypothetical protein